MGWILAGKGMFVWEGLGCFGRGSCYRGDWGSGG